jgi:hypothetical protein
MSNSDRNGRRVRGSAQQEGPIENRLRVRSRRLDQVGEDKLSLAFWLLAKQLVQDQTDDEPSPDDVVVGGDEGDHEVAA